MDRVTNEIKRNLKNGVHFGRVVQAMAQAKGNLIHALAIAESSFKDTPVVAECLKAAVAAGSASDATWASPLAEPTIAGQEFIELLRPLAILPRLAYVRAPMNTKFPRATAGTSAAFIKEGYPAPISKMDLDLLSLPPTKIVGICVLTDELIRNSSPAAAAMVSHDLAVAVASYLDHALLDPSRPAIPDQSPASIGYGATHFESSGNTAANVVADLKAMLLALTNKPGVRLASAVWVMSERVATYWSTLYNANSDFMFEDLTPAGGTLLGLPVLTTGSIPAAGSPSEETVTLLDPSSLAVADDGQTGVDVARNPSLQMLDDPATGAVTAFSLWQNNMVGLRITRFVSWVARRDGVAVLRSINF